MVFEDARRNGLECPLHPFQVLSYVLFAFFVALLYGLQLPFLGIEGRAALGCIFGLFFLVTLVAALVATSIDPSDPGLHQPPMSDRL